MWCILFQTNTIITNVMKQLTLTEQLKAVNLADEASQYSLIEDCSNIHFLTLAYMASGQSVEVKQRLLLLDHLHVVVLKVLESTMPDHLKGLVRNHRSYKEKKVDGLNFGKFIASFIYDRAEESYVPNDPARSPGWQKECRMRADDVEWQKRVIYGGSFSHIREMLGWISLTPELVKFILASYHVQTIDTFYAEALSEESVNLIEVHCATEAVRDLISNGGYVLRTVSKSKAFDEEAQALACYLFSEGWIDPSNVALIFPGATSHRKQILSVMEVFSSSVM